MPSPAKKADTAYDWTIMQPGSQGSAAGARRIVHIGNGRYMEELTAVDHIKRQKFVRSSLSFTRKTNPTYSTSG